MTRSTSLEVMRVSAPNNVGTSNARRNRARPRVTSPILVHPRTAASQESGGLLEWHDRRPTTPELFLHTFFQFLCTTQIARDGKCCRTAAGHQRSRGAVVPKEILQHRKPRIFLQGGSFEGIEELAARTAQITCIQE